MIIDYTEKYYEEVKELAMKHNLDLPSEGKMLLGLDESGKVKSLSIIRMVPTIEPMISENPIVGNELWNHIKERSKGQLKILRCFAKEEHIGLYKKLGFTEVFEGYTPMEFIVHKENGG